MRARFAIVSDAPAVRKSGHAHHNKTPSIAGAPSPSLLPRTRPGSKLPPVSRTTASLTRSAGDFHATQLTARKLSKHASHAEDDYTAALLQTPPLFSLDQPWVPPSSSLVTPKVSPGMATGPFVGVDASGVSHMGGIFTSPYSLGSAQTHHGGAHISPGRFSATGSLPGTASPPPLFQTAAAAAQAVHEMFPLTGFSNAGAVGGHQGASSLDPGHDDLLHGINMFSDPHDGMDFKDWLCGSPCDFPNYLITPRNP